MRAKACRTDGGAHSGGDGGAPSESCASENQTPETALAYAFGTDHRGCLRGANDTDYFKVTAPKKTRKGYITLRFTNVTSALSLQAVIRASSDGTNVQSVYTTTDGQDIYLYAGVTPGATYEIAVSAFGSVDKPGAFTMHAEYIGLEERAGSDLQGAALISENTDVSGYFMAPYTGVTTVDDAWSDWYAVDIDGSDVRIALTRVASDLSAQIELYDGSGKQLANEYRTTNGADVVLEQSGLEPGQRVYFSVHPFAGVLQTGGASTLPDFFTKPYALRVM